MSPAYIDGSRNIRGCYAAGVLQSCRVKHTGPFRANCLIGLDPQYQQKM
jgi:hypothetical protein